MKKFFRILLALYLVTSPILIVFLVYKTIFLTAKIFEFQGALLSKDAVSTYPMEAIQTAFAPHIGLPEAPVKVFWYTDLDCVACRQSFQDILDICQAYPEEVVVFVKFLPSVNEYTMRAHRLLLYAWLKGRFLEVAGQLFTDEASGRLTELRQWEESLMFPNNPGAADSYSQLLDKNLSEFQTLGTFSTPTMVVNGSVWRGWDKARLLAEIQTSLAPN